MYKIINIMNHHQWDGIELSQEKFWDLLNMLAISRYQFSMKYEYDGNSYTINNSNLLHMI